LIGSRLKFNLNKSTTPARENIYILSIITGRATPPSKGGDTYVINIQSIPGSVEGFIMYSSFEKEEKFSPVI
jgi:ribosomal protein S1